MKIVSEIVTPDNIEVTLSITMTLSEWRELVKDINTGYPGWKLRGAVNDLVYKINSGMTDTHQLV